MAVTGLLFGLVAIARFPEGHPLHPASAVLCLGSMLCFLVTNRRDAVDDALLVCYVIDGLLCVCCLTFASESVLLGLFALSYVRRHVLLSGSSF